MLFLFFTPFLALKGSLVMELDTWDEYNEQLMGRSGMDGEPGQAGEDLFPDCRIFTLNGKTFYSHLFHSSRIIHFSIDVLGILSICSFSSLFLLRREIPTLRGQKS